MVQQAQTLTNVCNWPRLSLHLLASNSQDPLQGLLSTNFWDHTHNTLLGTIYPIKWRFHLVVVADRRATARTTDPLSHAATSQKKSIARIFFSLLCCVHHDDSAVMNDVFVHQSKTILKKKREYLVTQKTQQKPPQQTNHKHHTQHWYFSEMKLGCFNCVPSSACHWYLWRWVIFPSSFPTKIS